MEFSEFVVAVGCVLAAASMGVSDSRMRRHTAEGVEPNELPPAPVAWGKPELFSGVGNTHRRRAQASCVLMTLLFLVLAVVL